MRSILTFRGSLQIRIAANALDLPIRLTELSPQGCSALPQTVLLGFQWRCVDCKLTDLRSSASFNASTFDAALSQPSR